MISIYLTCKNQTEARKIAKALLQKKLIACANYFPVGSLYRWKGKLVDETEIALMLKSREKHTAAIKREIQILHSYDVVGITIEKAQTTKDCADWIKKETA